MGVIVRHLKSSSLETALDVEPFVGFATIKNTLVASNIFCNVVQGLYDPQSKLLALLVFVYRNVLDMADPAQAMDEFALYNDCSRADNARVRVANDKNVICFIT